MALTDYAPVLGVFWKLIESRGQNPEPLFKSLRIDPALANDINARISYSKIEALWLGLQKLIGDPCIGLEFAKHFHPSNAGALGYAWLASSSLRTSAERLVRFSHVLAEGMEYRIEETNSEYVIIHAFPKGATDIPQQADAILATIVTMCRVNYGMDLNPLSVSLIHSAPDNTGDYFTHFRCPVHFDNPDNRITLPLEVVDKSLSTSNPQLALINDQIMIDYLGKLDKEHIIEQVKSIIIDQLPSGNVTDQSISKALFITPRTLQRKLQQKNSTFKTILNEVRKELANAYINDSSMSLSEISFLLGFSEISSFSRAFKRWTGNSPSTYRH